MKDFLGFFSLFYLISLLSLLSYSNLSIICEEGKDYFCQENQTCCRSIYGWNCISIFNANCCPDGLSGCEENEFCDGKSNECIVVDDNLKENSGFLKKKKEEEEDGRRKVDM